MPRMPTTTWSPFTQIAQTAADGVPFGDDDHGVHALILNFEPGAVVVDQSTVIGGRIKIFRSAAVLFDGGEVGVAGVDGGAAEPEQLGEQLLHVGGFRRFHLHPQIRGFGVRSPNAELFDLKTAVEFDHRIKDLLHQVRIDEVALGFDDFLLHLTFQDSVDAREKSSGFAQLVLVRFLLALDGVAIRAATPKAGRSMSAERWRSSRAEFLARFR